MASFWLYAITGDQVASPRREPRLSMENLKPGAELWLDGIDGFFDQFFESRRAGESMSFIALPPGDRHRMLRDLALFAGRAAQRAR